jgi:site-specific recombinase XerD
MGSTATASPASPPERDPLALTTPDLRRYLFALYPGDHQRNSYEQARKALVKFYAWAIESGYRTDNPARALKRSSIPKGKPKHLSTREAAAIEEVASHEGVVELAMARLYLYSGVRPSEGRGLAWRRPEKGEDPESEWTGVVNLEERTILVVKGKGSKERHIPIAPRSWRP